MQTLLVHMCVLTSCCSPPPPPPPRRGPPKIFSTCLSVNVEGQSR